MATRYLFTQPASIEVSLVRNALRSLAGVLALVMLAASASASGIDTSRSAEGFRLVSGEALVLATADGSGLVISSADDPVIRFVELAGTEVVARLTPIDRAGNTLGSGRVIVLGASEQRDVRLRDELTSEALGGVRLRVEVLQGGGRLLVSPLAKNGSVLRLEPGATGLTRRRAARPPAARPPSFTLIDAAETSGVLSSETALLYRVYALFGDARLPVQYLGDDSLIHGSLYMAQVRDRFATLAPATQEAVLPFLTAPAYRGSWANAAGSSPSILATPLATPPPCQFFSDKWAWVDSANGFVRVWYQVDPPEDQGRARSLVNLIDSTIWPAIAGLMTPRLPVPDLAEECNGGNGRLDVYLADVIKSAATAYGPCNGLPRSVFILMRRDTKAVLAVHEIFHAFQFANPLAGCITDERYRWWAEASAEWSQDFVFPKDNTEHHSAPAFLNAPEKELDQRDEDHEYGAYLLPFYVHKKTGSAAFVPTSWANSATQPALEALDLALPGGFEAVWPEFVKYNWNRAPVGDYKDWDGLTAGARPASGSSLVVGAAPDIKIDLTLGLPRLSATYKHFIFDESVRTLAFWNGVTTNLVLRERVLGGLTYENDAASSEQTKGAHITALIKIGGQWTTENWTDLPYRTYCRDMTAERLEELVLIISNSEFRSRDRKLEAPGLKPVLFATNMGCWQWKGTTHYDDGPGGLTLDTTATWTRDETSQTTPAISYQAKGTIVWKLKNDLCSGGGTLPIEGFNTMSTYNFITAEGTFHRSYMAVAAEPQAPLSITCGDSTVPLIGATWMLAPLQPFIAGIPRARFLLVNPAGTIMDDSHEFFPGQPAKWTWHFESQRQ